MSKYKEIATEFRNADSLRKALKEMGVEFQESANLKNPDLKMYGYQNDLRDERASFRLDRKFVNAKLSGGSSNDVGFRWNGQVFEAQISEYDSGWNERRGWLNEVRQKYALNEVRRQAWLKGYTLRETKLTDGTVRVICTMR
jgi:hypothetical protein